ncbi:MAG: NUDIX domain-containing protein [Clostridia bacterium]|nr:NUDIX domain-containing protein [Clostridia bacterium]
MGYLDDLREKIGTDPVIMPGANVIIINEKNEILMHHRRDRDWWGLPGGMMELGETLEETAVREVKEEINIKVSDLKLFNLYSGPEFFYIYPDGNQVHNVTATYICKHYKGEIIVEQTEGRDARFFALENLPENISSTIQPILNELKVRIREFI